MFRILLAVLILFVGTLQGVAIGKINIAVSDAQMVQLDQQEAVALDMDATDLLIDNIPSHCKSDCKAVVPISELFAGKTFTDFDTSRFDFHNPVPRQVDLRPPIS